MVWGKGGFSESAAEEIFAPCLGSMEADQGILGSGRDRARSGRWEPGGCSSVCCQWDQQESGQLEFELSFSGYGREGMGKENASMEVI